MLDCNVEIAKLQYMIENIEKKYNEGCVYEKYTVSLRCIRNSPTT